MQERIRRRSWVTKRSKIQQKCLFVRADGIKIIFWDEKEEADDAKIF